jgi:hypothetical protein
LRKSTDKGPMARRLRTSALQESDFQAFGNPSRFNPGGNSSSLKENGLKILARSRLAPPDYAIIEALLKVIQSHQKIEIKLPIGIGESPIKLKMVLY